MKSCFLICTVACSILSAGAEEPTNAPSEWSTNQVQRQTNSARPWQMKRVAGEGEMRQKKQSREERRLLLMERELKRIGVTEEEKAQINALQKDHRHKMSANAERIAAARKHLAELMDQGAPMEAVEAAINEITAAQAEQLRILVYNRIEMERILGKEKYEAFMNNARKQFQKHGRRGGPPLPPRPELPPVPGQPAAETRPSEPTGTP